MPWLLNLLRWLLLLRRTMFTSRACEGPLTLAAYHSQQLLILALCVYVGLCLSVCLFLCRVGHPDQPCRRIVGAGGDNDVW